MNFDKIKSDFPKAWEWLSDWAHPQGKSFTYYLGIGWRSSMGDRDLYEFFDAQEIYIRQNWTITDSEESEKMEFFCAIWEYNVCISGTDDFPTRAAAESSAFEKAFEILENKLK